MSLKKLKKISMTDYAKRRGVSMPIVKKAIKDQIISDAVTLGKNGRKLIDPQMADALWDSHDAITNGPKLRQEIGPGAGYREGSIMMDPEDKASAAAYSKARASKEAIGARLAMVKLDRLTGSLVEVEEVKKAARTVAANVKNALTNWPNRLAPILAAETDIIKIKSILKEEINFALENLSRGDYDFLKDIPPPQGFDADEDDDANE